MITGGEGITRTRRDLAAIAKLAVFGLKYEPIVFIAQALLKKMTNKLLILTLIRIAKLKPYG